MPPMPRFLSERDPFGLGAQMQQGLSPLPPGFAPSPQEQAGTLPAIPQGMFGAPLEPKRSTADKIVSGIGAFANTLNANLGGAPGQAWLQQQQLESQSKRDSLKQGYEFQRQLALARYKTMNPDDTATVKNARAAGLQPGTPEWTQFIRDSSVPPHFVTVGSPETGQTIVNASAMPQGNPLTPPNSPPPEAVSHLRSDPSLAAQFDEVFGPGAAQRALGGR